MGRREAGQATVEWTALVLAIALALGALGYVAARGASWRFGSEIFDAIVCAAGDGCPNALEDAYGEGLAEAVRRYAPSIAYERRSAQLPVDFRRCREPSCSNGSDRPAGIDESETGLPGDRVHPRDGPARKRGAALSPVLALLSRGFTAGIGRSSGRSQIGGPAITATTGRAFRSDPPGGAGGARDGTRRLPRRGRFRGWDGWNGWYRVSGGSHAGQLLPGAAAERTTSAERLWLVPLETLREPPVPLRGASAVAEGRLSRPRGCVVLNLAPG